MPRTMLPAPITSATSAPLWCTSTISRAIDSMRPGSTPYSRSPISASPESLTRTRLKAACALGAGWGLRVTGLLCQGEALELKHLQPCLGERGADGRVRVVDPRLVLEHGFGVPLVEAAGDDLLAHLLGLVLDVRLLCQDLALGLDVGLGNLAARRVPWPGERNVHRQLAGRRRGAAPVFDEHADLVRRRVDVLGEPHRAVHGDVLADPADELGALLLELRDDIRTARLDGLQRPLGEAQELLVSGHGLGLAADGYHRADVAPDRGEDDALSRLPAGALPGLGHPSLAKQLASRFEIPAGLLERALAIHHRRGRQVAELLDESGRDLAHWLPACCSGSGSSTASGSAGCPFSGAVSAVCANSAGVARAAPAATPSAITRVTRLQERIASSLPGMTKSASSGSQFVSTSATNGMPR